MRDIIPSRWQTNPRQLASVFNPKAVPDPASRISRNFPTPESDGSPILTTGPNDVPASGLADVGPQTAGIGLSPQQRLAVAALVCGRTFSSAAIQARVDRKTLYTWRKQPAFQAAVDELSREAFEATAVRARNLMLKATRTLGEALCGNERFAWAIRIANSKRLWEIGQVAKAEADDVEPQNESPADGAVGG